MSKTTAALQYLHSTIDWDVEESVVTVMKKGDITTRYNSKPNEYPRITHEFPGNNPIDRMVEHVEEEICMDCLEIEYLYKDPFFLSLIKAYVETIVIRYGSEVSISRLMAHAIIEHKLSNYNIYCRTLHETILLSANNYKDYASDNCIYILTTYNDRPREIYTDQ